MLMSMFYIYLITLCATGFGYFLYSRIFGLTRSLFFNSNGLQIAVFSYQLFKTQNDKAKLENNIYNHAFYAILGFPLIYCLSAILNFFSPIGFAFSLLFFIFGLCFYLYFLYEEVIGTKILNSILISSLCVIFTCLIYQSASLGSDAGGYHIPSVIWIKSSSVPFGLANINKRLGFVSSWHSVSAILDLAKNYYSTAALIYCIIFYIVKQAVVSVKLRVFDNIFLFNIFLILAFIVMSNDFFRSNISTPENDIPSTVYSIFLLQFFFFVLNVWEKTDGLFKNHREVLSLTFYISIYCITIKPSQILIFISFLFVLFYYIKNVKSKSLDLPITHFSLVFVFILLPYLFKHFLVSGCLLFPSIHTCLPVQWGVRPQTTITSYNEIIAFARNSHGNEDEVLNSSTWILEWIKDPKNAVFLILVIVSIFILIKMIGRIIEEKLISNISFICVFLVSICSCLYAFMTAPDRRFVYGFLVVLFVLIFTYSSSKLINIKNQKSLKRIFSFVFVFCLLFSLISNVKRIKKIEDLVFVHKPVPIPNLQSSKSEYGFEFNYSIDTDPSCYAARLPCVQYPDELVKVERKKITPFSYAFIDHRNDEN